MTIVSNTSPLCYLTLIGHAEIRSDLVGQKVMEKLRTLDDVAYVRFASVYRKFADVDSLAEEIKALKERKQREVELKAQLKLI